MSDARGSLGALSLPGLLQLLAAEERTGRLDLSTLGGRRGALWLEGGLVVHAEGFDEEGESAALRLLGLEEGDFDFLLGAGPPRRSLSASAGQLLLESARQRDHARAVHDGVTALPADTVPVLAPEPPGGTSPRFDTLQWRLLASVDGRRDVAGVAEAAGVPGEAAAEILAELVRVGVLQLTQGP